MRFLVVFCLTAAGVGLSLYHEICAPVMMQFFYYGGQGLWYGPEWFKPVLFLNVFSLLILMVKYGSIRIGYTGWVLLAFCAVMAMSAGQAVRSSEVAMDYTIEISKMVISYLIFYNFALKLGTNFAKVFMWANVIGGVYLAKSVLYAYIADPGKRVDAAIGQGGGANYIAMLFAMFIPFLLAQAVSQQGARRIWLYGLSVVFITCIVATGSRAGLITLVIVVLCALSQKGISKVKIFGMGCVLFLTMLPFIPDYYLERMQTVSNYSEDESASNRVLQWRAACEMFKDSPLLGIGPKNFYLVSHRYTGVHSNEVFEGERVGLVTHNTYLEILSENGLCGVLLVGILFLANLKYHRIGTSLDRSDGCARIGLEGGLVAYGICAMFGSLLLRDVLYWYLAVYNGWVASLLDHERKSQHDSCRAIPKGGLPSVQYGNRGELVQTSRSVETISVAVAARAQAHAGRNAE